MMPMPGMSRPDLPSVDRSSGQRPQPHCMESGSYSANLPSIVGAEGDPIVGPPAVASDHQTAGAVLNRQSAIDNRHRRVARKKTRHEYEGESHDIVENKGQIFLSHDLYDK
jgi:hypothetical protein